MFQCDSSAAVDVHVIGRCVIACAQLACARTVFAVVHGLHTIVNSLRYLYKLCIICREAGAVESAREVPERQVRMQFPIPACSQPLGGLSFRNSHYIPMMFKMLRLLLHVARCA